LWFVHGQLHHYTENQMGAKLDALIEEARVEEVQFK